MYIKNFLNKVFKFGAYSLLFLLVLALLGVGKIFFNNFKIKNVINFNPINEARADASSSCGSPSDSNSDSGCCSGCSDSSSSSDSSAGGCDGDSGSSSDCGCM